MSPILYLACALAIAATCLPGPSPTTTLPRPAPVPAAVGPAPVGPGAPADPQDPVPPQTGSGHLVLVVEGDARSLRITHAVAKPDPWAGVAKGLLSDFALLALDDRGAELVRVPLDLSKFETDPAKAGGPVVVHGCEVRSPRIGVLVNFPVVPDAARYLLVRGGATLGEATAAAIDELLRRMR